MFSLLVLLNAAKGYQKVCDFRITMESDAQFSFSNGTSLYTQVQSVHFHYRRSLEIVVF